MRIVVLSSFWLDGQAHPEGASLEVPDRLGQELILNHKAAKAAAEPAADENASDPAADPAPAPKAAARRKQERT